LQAVSRVDPEALVATQVSAFKSRVRSSLSDDSTTNNNVEKIDNALNIFLAEEKIVSVVVFNSNKVLQSTIIPFCEKHNKNLNIFVLDESTFTLMSEETKLDFKSSIILIGSNDLRLSKLNLDFMFLYDAKLLLIDNNDQTLPFPPMVSRMRSIYEDMSVSIFAHRS
jgi:hypothetical protein